MIPAAIGAEADVPEHTKKKVPNKGFSLNRTSPVWFSVHWLRRSVETTCFSSDAPLLYVVANVDEQASEYQGIFPFSVALEIDTVYIEFV